VLSGHIHNAPFYADGAWIDRLGQSWVLNAGRQIGPRPSHVILDFNNMTARWVSAEESLTQNLGSFGPVTAPDASGVGA
jgi:hypothetical protein